MASYATYAQYTTDYLGTLIASANFAALALRASAQIDAMTFDRVAPIVLAATETATIALIVQATCAVAEEIQTVEADGSIGGIQSESVGQHSVTYAANSFKLLSSKERYSEAAKTYLGNTGLLFRGFGTDELGGTFDDDD